MSVTAGVGFQLVESLLNTVETVKRVNREGYLLVLHYTKGDETSISFKIKMILHDDTTKYVLTETDSDDNIIEWERTLTSPTPSSVFDTIYPVRLHGKIEKFFVYITFNGTSGSEGLVDISGIADGFNVL